MDLCCGSDALTPLAALSIVSRFDALFRKRTRLYKYCEQLYALFSYNR